MLQRILQSTELNIYMVVQIQYIIKYLYSISNVGLIGLKHGINQVVVLSINVSFNIFLKGQNPNLCQRLIPILFGEQKKIKYESNEKSLRLIPILFGERFSVKTLSHPTSKYIQEEILHGNKVLRKKYLVGYELDKKLKFFLIKTSSEVYFLECLIYICCPLSIKKMLHEYFKSHL